MPDTGTRIDTIARKIIAGDRLLKIDSLMFMDEPPLVEWAFERVGVVEITIWGSRHMHTITTNEDTPVTVLRP